jgi:predicted negative regulator of RcsB-dependent stress response
LPAQGETYVSQHDEEQIESLKRFWQDYGTPILVGVAIAVSVFAGWRYWQADKLNSAATASAAFQDMLGAAQRSQLNPDDKAASTEVQRAAKSLKDDYAGTPYAISAAMLQARQAIDRGDNKDAEKQLRWVLDQKPAEAMRVLATTRLARVLAADKQLDAAIALLNSEQAVGFEPTIEELKGDIYQAQGKMNDARNAYQAASKALQARDERSSILELKMADVGLAPSETVESASAVSEGPAS